MIPLAKSNKIVPEPLFLNEGEVHIWYVGLDCSGLLLQQLTQTLSSDELARAIRFRFNKDKNRYIAARGFLRDILSHYLHTSAVEISFIYNPQGKPTLQDKQVNQNLMFNVSHSHGIALYAVTRKKNIGIDIEQIRNDLEYDKIATRFYSQQEISTLHSLPEHLKARAFYNCWTRKEAYLKARGEGLMTPLKQFAVSLAPGEPAVILNCQWDSNEPSHWSLHELDLGHEYVATLAVEGNPTNITCKPWSL